ncbi:MAG: hypothetical protein KME07_02195 [Pegethrix bostrychoides GSE-TBD4-15B]|uniref:Uncharacterized protein n=1 Tax=Pegethrix bostrychoides GSE-TBD4-15B TaxID=2839662 RepID=A0A951U3C1_9CYAN|nr:hypothetical protein [Pegethrix bostrychoides GSE-TBD4-15B]
MHSLCVLIFIIEVSLLARLPLSALYLGRFAQYLPSVCPIFAQHLPSVPGIDRAIFAGNGGVTADSEWAAAA